MDYSRLEKQIMSDEGFEPRPYLDTLGIPTIGYGATRILGQSVSMDDPAITAQNARQLLRMDLYGALTDAQALFVRFDEIDPVRQEVLVNMAYNLGLVRLSLFKRLIAAALKLDYELMADEMTTSNWFRQVGDRSIRLVDEMRYG